MNFDALWLDTTHEQTVHYRKLVFGFLFHWRPYHAIDNEFDVKTNPEMGSYFRKFVAAFKNALLGGSKLPPVNSWDLSTASAVSPRIIFIRRMGHGPRSMPQSTEDFFYAAFKAQHLELDYASFGEAELHNYQQQALFSSSVDVLIGIEGAGFLQQLFMPLNSVLIILHCKDGKETDVGKNRWHEAVGWYLDHSVLNIVSTRLDQISSVEMLQIAKAVAWFLRLHQKWRSQRLFGSCDMIDLSGWSEGVSGQRCSEFNRSAY